MVDLTVAVSLTVFCLQFNYFMIEYLKSEQQEDNKINIQDYLISNNYQLESLTPIRTSGATDCSYYVASLSNGEKIFIKKGDKVDKEVRVITKLSRLGIHEHIPELYHGSSENEQILITKFFNDSTAGYKEVNEFYSGKIACDSFREFNYLALDALEELYKKDDFNTAYRTEMFDIRAKDRLTSIFHDEKLTFPCHGEKCDLSKILNLPITYFNNDGDSIMLPPVATMNAIFTEKVTKIPGLKARIVHGDFHPPNIVRDDNRKIHIVDWSDVRFGEDPSWDLGKWSNYLKRFYRVALARQSGEDDNSIDMVVADHVSINDSYHNRYR